MDCPLVVVVSVVRCALHSVCVSARCAAVDHSATTGSSEVSFPMLSRLCRAGAGAGLLVARHNDTPRVLITPELATNLREVLAITEKTPTILWPSPG